MRRRLLLKLISYKVSVNLVTVKQKKRALNRMYHHVYTNKRCLQKRKKYATNSDDKKWFPELILKLAIL